MHGQRAYEWSGSPYNRRTTATEEDLLYLKGPLAAWAKRVRGRTGVLLSHDVQNVVLLLLSTF